MNYSKTLRAILHIQQCKMLWSSDIKDREQRPLLARITWAVDATRSQNLARQPDIKISKPSMQPDIKASKTGSPPDLRSNIQKQVGWGT